jgi:hypothetical protein
MYNHFKSKGYYVEESNSSLENINLSKYSVFILIDKEKQLSDIELKNLTKYFEEEEVSILIISEWNDEYIKEIVYYVDPEGEKVEPNVQ